MTPPTRAALEALEAAREVLRENSYNGAGWRSLHGPVSYERWRRAQDQIRAALSLLAAPGREDGAEGKALTEAQYLEAFADDQSFARRRIRTGLREIIVLLGGRPVTDPDGIHLPLPLPAAPAQEAIRFPNGGEIAVKAETGPDDLMSSVPPAGAPDPERGECGGFRVTADLLTPAPRAEPGADLLARVRAMLDVIDGITAYDDASGRRCYVDLDTQALHFSTGLDTLDAAYRDVLAALQARERGDG